MGAIKSEGKASNLIAQPMKTPVKKRSVNHAKVKGFRLLVWKRSQKHVAAAVKHTMLLSRRISRYWRVWPVSNRTRKEAKREAEMETPMLCRVMNVRGTREAPKKAATRLGMKKKNFRKKKVSKPKKGTRNFTALPRKEHQQGTQVQWIQIESFLHS